MGSVVTDRLRQQRIEEGTHRAPPARPVLYPLTPIVPVKTPMPPGTTSDLAKSSLAAFMGFPMDIATSLAPPGLGMRATSIGPQLIMGDEARVIAEVREAQGPIDPKDQEFTTAWFQDKFGANPDTVAAHVGQWVDPQLGAKKTIPIIAGSLLGEGAMLTKSIANMIGKGKRSIKDNLALAKQLLSDYPNMSQQNIWLQTGWVLDPEDAAWKYQVNSWDLNYGKWN
jgi:hypothetical protein